MQTPIALIQHDDLGPAGWLEDLLSTRSVAYQVVQLHKGESLPGEYSGVVSLGGRMSAYEEEANQFLIEEKRFLRAAVDERRPVLGICLGCQLLAAALGGRVFPARRLEAGYVPLHLNAAGRDDPVLRGQVDQVLSFHFDTWEPPPGAQILAESDWFPQAFRVGTALGIQFHPEPPPALVEQWVLNNEMALREAGVDPAALVAEAKDREPRSRQLAFELFGAWLDDADRP